MIVENKRNIKEIEQEKSQKIMETVAWRAGYYRANPQRFCKDILNITLKWFQVILLWAMMHNNFFMYLAARGQGKTFLTAIFLVCRCVLYPNSKIIVTSATLKQANEVLLKIQDEIYPHSSILQSCIKEMKIGQNDATILFKGGSWIKTRTSTENSRSARANIIVVDEFRMVDKKILDSVIREFLKAPRHPKYLDKPEYAHLTEEVGTNQLVSYGLTLDYVVGKYKTYTKLYLSKDEKTLKVFESYCEPVKAPHDKEIQGKTTYNVFLKENAKIDDNFSNIGGRPMRIETRSETTFSNVEGKVQEFTYYA